MPFGQRLRQLKDGYSSSSITITNFKNQILGSGLNLGDDTKNVIGIQGNLDNGAIKNLIPNLGLNLGNEAKERNGILNRRLIYRGRENRYDRFSR